MAEEFVTRKELHGIVKTAVADALREYQHECVLDLSSEELRQVDNLFSTIRTIGEGDLVKGIDHIRENHQFITKYVSITGRIGTIVITSITIFVIGLVGSVLWEGIISRSKEVLK